MHIILDQEPILKLGIGMTKLGIRENHNPDYIDRRANVIEKATELGRILVDTSPIYGNGFSEDVTSKVISRLKQKLFISTKYYPQDKHRRCDVINSIKGSISRLKIDKIDLLQIHWPNWLADTEEICEGLIEAKQLGLIKNIGVCNFSDKELSEIQKIKKLPIISNQIELNLLNINDYSKKRLDLVEILYGSLLQGRLTDVNHRTHLISWSKNYGLKPSVVTVAYLLKRSYPSICVAKVSSIDHLSDLIQALELKLDPMLEDQLFSINTDTQYIDHSQIILKGDQYRDPYLTFEDAINNKLDLFPSPLSLAVRTLKFDLVSPIKVFRTSDLYEVDNYDPFDQVKKFWAWRIAYPDAKIPIRVIS